MTLQPNSVTANNHHEIVNDKNKAIYLCSKPDFGKVLKFQCAPLVAWKKNHDKH